MAANKLVISKCSCVHQYQDNLYGKGNRVCNPMKKDGDCRCTVCGKVLKY